MAKASRILAYLSGTGFADRCLNEAILKLESGDISGAEAAIAEALRRNLDEPDFNTEFNAGVIRARAGQLSVAEENLVRALKLRPTSTHAAYALGSVRALRGKIADALEMFKTDLPVMTGTGRNTYTSVLYLDDHSGPGVSRSRIVDIAQIPTSPDARAIYVVVSDSVYFCRYASAVLRSMKLNAGGNVHLHAHIINPTVAASEVGLSLGKVDGVSISTETINLNDLNDDQRKTYYASARFLLLSELRPVVRKPILLCDIDQLVMADIGPILRTADRRDVSLIHVDGQAHNILSLVSATALLVMPTKGADWFCSRLAQDINNALAHPRRLSWHLDQAALAMAYLTLPSVKYGVLPPSMIHLTEGEPPPDRPADSGILWSITSSIEGNITKLDTPTFKSLST